MLRSNISAPSGRGSPLMFSAASSRIVTLPFSPTKLGKDMEKSLGKKARLLFSLKLQWFLKKCFSIKCLLLVNFQGPEIVTFNTLAQFYAHLFSWTCSCPHSKKSLIPLHPPFLIPILCLYSKIYIHYHSLPYTDDCLKYSVGESSGNVCRSNIPCFLR